MANWGGVIIASQEDVFQSLLRFSEEKNAVIYIDPPYIDTTGYDQNFDIYELINRIKFSFPIYISEGFKLEGKTRAYLLSNGRKKGNISGDIKKTPVEEWLNVFA